MESPFATIWRQPKLVAGHLYQRSVHWPRSNKLSQGNCHYRQKSQRASFLTCRAARPAQDSRTAQRGGKGRERRGQRPSDVPSRPPSLRQQRPAQAPPPGRQLQQQYSDEESEDDEDMSTPVGLMPSPPAGFVLDSAGEVVLMAPSDRRIVKIVDKLTGLPLECLIRRAFLSSNGLQFFLLLPLDTPIEIFRVVGTTRSGGLQELEDSEVKEVIPNSAYALAKKSLHLVHSGFCLTARGAVCFAEDDIVDINSEYGDSGIGGNNLSEGVEICAFVSKGKEYVIFTPFDPVLFVAYRTEDGELLLAEDELLDDPKVIEAIEEEEEFKNMTEEEDAVRDALREAIGAANQQRRRSRS